jgi:hypothetical protein
MARSNPNLYSKTAQQKKVAKKSVAKPSVASVIADLRMQVAQLRAKIGQRTVKYNLKLCLMEQEAVCLMDKIKNLRDDTSP